MKTSPIRTKISRALFVLLYCRGKAHVFEITATGTGLLREFLDTNTFINKLYLNPHLRSSIHIMGGSYEDCERFIAGARRAGAWIVVAHCDIKIGKEYLIAQALQEQKWNDGEGDQYAPMKHGLDLINVPDEGGRS